MIPIAIGLSFLVFLLLYISPGDPAQKKLTSQGVAVSQEVLEKTREEMGLNRPFLVQYGDWFAGLFRGDFGSSYKDGTPVLSKLTKGLRYTAVLTASSLILSILISLPLGIYTAVKKNRFVDYFIRFLTFIGNSLPNFLISVLLMYFFCIQINLFPVISKENIQGLILPTLALSIPMTSRFIRQFRAEILDQLGRPYVAGARARGVKERFVLLGNVLHNSMASILTIIGLSVGTLLGGSVVIETIFTWPGIGKLVMDSITARDYPVIQGFVIFMAVIYMVVNLLTDISYRYLDPRLRNE